MNINNLFNDDFEFPVTDISNITEETKNINKNTENKTDKTKNTNKTDKTKNTNKTDKTKNIDKTDKTDKTNKTENTYKTEIKYCWLYKNKNETHWFLFDNNISKILENSFNKKLKLVSTILNNREFIFDLSNMIQYFSDENIYKKIIRVNNPQDYI